MVRNLYDRPGDDWVGEPKVRVISLGAGVQSSVMALIAAKTGKFGKIDKAIFADTGWEPKGVYEHLEWLEGELKKQPHGFEVIHASVKDLYEARGKPKNDWRIQDHLLAGKNSTGQDFITVPVFVKQEGKKGLARRQCTREYKLEPIRFHLRKLMGIGRGQRAKKGEWAEQLLGISLDEMTRMKNSRDDWCRNRWHLIEERMRREDCIQWFAEHYPGRTLPRSACIGCPLHTNEEWRAMRDGDKESWDNAVAADNALRERRTGHGAEMYLHRNCEPLGETDIDHEGDSRQLSLLDECDGLCGV